MYVYKIKFNGDLFFPLLLLQEKKKKKSNEI